MINADFKMDVEPLKRVLEVLKKDNLDIEDIIKKINNAIRILDERNWNASEKKRLDSDLVPYIDNLDNSILNFYNECTDTLSYAINSYVEANQFIRQSTSNLTGAEDIIVTTSEGF